MTKKEETKTKAPTIAEQLGEMKQALPLSYIARNYFKKSPSWLSQRINGTPVRGRVYTLNEEQKEIFHRALRDISQLYLSQLLD